MKTSSIQSQSLSRTGFCGAVALAAVLAVSGCGKTIEDDNATGSNPAAAGSSSARASASTTTSPAGPKNTPSGPPHQYVAPSTGDAKVDQLREDMRNMANALDAYYKDHKSFPPSTEDPAKSVNAELAAAHAEDTWNTPAFQRPGEGEDFHLLTTPVAYMAAFPVDPFAKTPGRTYAYFRTTGRQASGRELDGWILWSPGPDGDFDFDWKLYDPANILANVEKPEWSNALYDPTNGAGSSGDLMRIR